MKVKISTNLFIEKSESRGASIIVIDFEDPTLPQITIDKLACSVYCKIGNSLKVIDWAKLELVPDEKIDVKSSPSSGDSGFKVEPTGNYKRITFEQEMLDCCKKLPQLYVANKTVRFNKKQWRQYVVERAIADPYSEFLSAIHPRNRGKFEDSLLAFFAKNFKDSQALISMWHVGLFLYAEPKKFRASVGKMASLKSVGKHKERTPGANGDKIMALAIWIFDPLKKRLKETVESFGSK